MQTIVIADPESDFLEWAVNQLATPLTRVLIATRSDEAYKMYCSEKADLLIADTHLQPMSGLELLAKVRQHDSNAMVVLTSAFGTTQAVIESMKLGAFDFIRKEALPFSIKVVVDAALRQQAELNAATAFKPTLTVEQHQDSLVGKSEAIQQVFKMVGRVASSDAPVMITGESGSGKELVARAIHHYSRRSDKYFVAINCAAIPEALLESELFGHEKGAFTGAVAQRVGRFEQSDGGTLFLDEIGEMPLAVQGKMLRVLQDGEFSRVGGSETLKTDVRIVAATNKHLEEQVSLKLFREDLFYRLNVVRIHLPPLRQRLEDVRLLAEYFLARIAAQQRLPRLRLSEETVRALENYNWPGNVRELENTIQRAAVLATSDVLLPKDIPMGGINGGERSSAGLMAAGAVEPRSESGEENAVQSAVETLFAAAARDTELQLLPWLEREFTIAAMKQTHGNQLKAAKLLGVTRATLRKRIERFGITRQLRIQ
jgi:DNA-binding NtrC family response regulator